MHYKVIPLLLAIFFVSCNRYETNENGLRYKTHYLSKEGRKVKEGEMVLCYYTVQYEDSILYSTYDFPDPARIVAFPSSYKGDLFEGLQTMKEGDSVSFLFSADSFYTKNFQVDLPSFIPPKEDVKVTMKVYKVLSEPEYEAYLEHEEEQHLEKEREDIQNYIKDNYLMMSYDSFSNVWYRRTLKQDSVGLVQEGDLVSFHCLARTLNGNTIINTYTENKPITITVGAKQFQLPVLEELLQFLDEGGRGKFIVSYMNCFGPKGDGYRIPQYSTFVFDIFIEKVVH